MDEKVALRPAGDADRPFLARVYATTREAELAPLPWSEDQKAAFLAQQFEAQDVHYRTHYVGAAFDVIEVEGEPAGRLYLHRGPREIRVIDIALLPSFRGRGIGSSLLSALQEEADAGGRALSIHVEIDNPARRLYERLGFRYADDHGVYLQMVYVNTAS